MLPLTKQLTCSDLNLYFTDDFTKMTETPKTPTDQGIDMGDTIDRSHVQEGDVIYHTQARSHAWLNPHTDTLLDWMDIPTHGEHDYTEHELDTEVSRGVIEIVDEHVTDIRAFHVRTNHKYADPSRLDVGGAASTKSLHLDVFRGTGMKKDIDSFLKHPEVGYDHDTLGNTAKLTLVARNRREEIVAIAVIGTPVASQEADNVAVLRRFAAHPDRPENTGSWLIARAAEWCDLQGWERLKSHAGVANNNKGIMYDAAGFTREADVVESDLSGWNNKPGANKEGTYMKRTWWNELTQYDYTHRNADNRPGSMTRLTKQSIDTEVSVNNSVVTREMAKDEDRNWQIGVEAKKFLEERGEVVPDAESVYAVFGIRAEGALRGVALVMDDTGEFRDNFESVTVQQVTVDGVRYEDQAARWLIAKIRRWATLHGFDRVNAVTESKPVTSALRGSSFHQAEADGGENPSGEVWTVQTEDN